MSLRDEGNRTASNVCLPHLGPGPRNVMAPLTNRAHARGGQRREGKDISEGRTGDVTREHA